MIISLLTNPLIFFPINHDYLISYKLLFNTGFKIESSQVKPLYTDSIHFSKQIYQNNDTQNMHLWHR